MRRLLMIGGWTDVYRKAKTLGFDLTVIQNRNDIKPDDPAAMDQLVTAPLSDKSIHPIVDTLHRERPFDAVVSFQELGVLNAALIAQRLGIRGNPMRPVLLTRDKCEMRRHLRSAGIASIPFAEVVSAQTIIEFGDKVGWPVIVKPANGVGSIQVHKVESALQAAAVYSEILADPVFCEITKMDFPEAKLIVEKFMHGREVSVEAITWEGAHSVVGVTDKLIVGDGNFVEMGHTVPTDLPADTVARIEQLVVRFLDSIGHRYGPSHTELILCNGEPVIVESHTRTGGDRIFELIERVYGVDMINETLKGFAGTFDGIRSRLQGGAAIRYLPGVVGTIVALRGVDIAQAIEGVVRTDINVRIGANVKVPKHSAERLGYVLAVGDSRGTAMRTAERALEAIVLEVAP